MNKEYDVLIIGAGPAGLSAAMALGRMSRTALVCDDDRPRNAASEHMNNFPSHDGLHPAEWRKKTRKELEKYKTIQFLSASVLSIEKEGSVFHAKLSSGQNPKFKKIILAYGVQDRLPQVHGIQELWGKSVFHCPYCHGYEVRDTRLGLIANGKIAEHLLPMIYSLSKDCILFTNGPADLAEDFRKAIQKNGIKLVETPIQSLTHEGLKLKSVTLENGEVYARDGLFAGPILPLSGKSPIGESLGCQKNEMGFYQLDMFGKTSVDGVFAAGDIAVRAHSVLNAAASGQMAGAGVASELLQEKFRA